MDTENASACSSDGAAGSRLAYVPHLPVLRPPPGWAVLDEAALRSRAVQLFRVCVEESRKDQCRGQVAGRSSGTRLLRGDADEEAHARPSPTATRAENAPDVADEPGTSGARSRSGWLWRGLPALMLLGGLILLAPWLVWAPLVGGVCLGILLLQTGLLARWLAIRKAQDWPERRETAGAESDEAGTGVTVRRDSPALEVLQGSAISHQQGPGRHRGWLLAAVLVLVGVQAALLIATLEIRRAEPLLQAGTAAGAPGRSGAQEAGVADGAPRVMLPALLAGKDGSGAGAAGDAEAREARR